MGWVGIGKFRGLPVLRQEALTPLSSRLWDAPADHRCVGVRSRSKRSPLDATANSETLSYSASHESRENRRSIRYAFPNSKRSWRMCLANYGS